MTPAVAALAPAKPCPVVAGSSASHAASVEAEHSRAAGSAS